MGWPYYKHSPEGGLMGMFDFLKGKRKAVVKKVVIKPGIKSSNPSKEQPVVELKSIPVNSDLPYCDKVTDIEENVYTTVKIGIMKWKLLYTDRCGYKSDVVTQR
jgi:hypothetical protein